MVRALSIFIAALCMVSTLTSLAGSAGGTGGGESPFPFGQEIPFPWASIEGTWQIEDKFLTDLFVFETRKNTDGTRLLNVKHVDGVSGAIAGTGVGFANSDGKLVTAAMSGPGTLYRVTVRAFHDLPGVRRKTATVLSIQAMGSPPNEENHYLLRKIDSNKR